MKKYLTYLISSLGGFQFGYNFVIMAGAILFITPAFSLSPMQESYLMSSIVVGCLLGASIAGGVVNQLGRKPTQLCLALLFLWGVSLVIFASSVNLLMLGRFIQGIAGGAVTVVSPLYLAEVAPPERRGFIVGFHQFAVTFGVLFGYGVSYLFSFSGSWRAMLGCGLIPALLYLIGLFKISESMPVSAKKFSSWKEVFKPEFRSPLIAVVFLNIFQQLIGINAVLAYAPMIFCSAGMKTVSMALFSTLIMGVINVFSTWISVMVIDRKGRRPLLMYSVGGVLFSLLVITGAFFVGSSATGWLVVLGVIVYTIAFGIGMGPIPGLIVSELFPHTIRGPATSFAALCNWIFNFGVIFTFLEITDVLGYQGTFAIYTVFAMIALIFVWRKIPETVGSVLK